MNFERIVKATAGVALLLAVLDHVFGVKPVGGNDVVQTALLLTIGVGMAHVLQLFYREDRDNRRDREAAPEVNIPGVYVGPERRHGVADRRTARAGGRRSTDR